jgi:hypothetical protein
MSDAPIVELPRPPIPAPPMTVPVLLRAVGIGCAVGVLVLMVDRWAPGRIAPLVRYLDPAATLLIGGGPLPASLLGLSVAMNGVFYALIAMVALVGMTVAGVRASFERHHWLMLGTLMLGMMAARVAMFRG